MLPTTSVTATVLTRAAQPKAQVVVWTLLPPILFSDSFSSDPRVMKRVFSSALLLACPGVILFCFATAAYIRYTFGPVPGMQELNEPELSHWPWFSAILLGAILAATDPPGIEEELKRARAPTKLIMLIVGEALLNDGTVAVLFKSAHELASGRDEWHIGWVLCCNKVKLIPMQRLHDSCESPKIHANPPRFMRIPPLKKIHAVLGP